VAVVSGTVLGLTIALPLTATSTGATPAPSDPAPTATPGLPGIVIDPPVEAADDPSSTSSTSSTSSSTTSTSTTTTTVPAPPVTSGLIPPLVDSGQPAQVGDAAATGRSRSRARARSTTSGPTLPLTGESSLAVLAAGLGALAIGGGALWWGSRRPRRAADAVEAGPPATG
jgi:LPXTG-motif cell wall-anchored protein